MIKYQTAANHHMPQIASLHAESWRKVYRGIFPDEYLDGPVYNDRIQVWSGRFAAPAHNQHTIAAIDGDILAGFACMYFDEDAVYGNLIDNLHVDNRYQGKGIGAGLIKMSAKAFYNRDENARFYLWVFEENYNARKFYERLGAINQEVVQLENPGGTYNATCRYVWPDVLHLV